MPVGGTVDRAGDGGFSGGGGADIVGGACGVDDIGDARALGERELRGDQVDAARHLGDRMLDLDARIHLHERHRAVRVDEELDRAGARVPRALADRDRRALEPILGLLREERGGRLLDELLIATLQRTVARTDGDHAAGTVAEHLHLHVTRAREEPFDEAVAVAERDLGLMRGGDERLLHVLEFVDDLEAAPAAAVHGLDGERQSVLARERDHLRRVVHRFRGARGHRRAHVGGDATRLHLRAEHTDRLRARTDPCEARVDDRLREIRVLGKEAVAGVHGVRVGFLRDVDDLGDVEICVLRSFAVERIGLVGEMDEQGVRIRIGVDGDGRAARVMAGVDDAHRDFAAVRDEDAGETVAG